MKLHRIETTNLNSLYGDQLVDLDDGLRGAGLFLVQGPTGSGKSTLMDAVSLALFGTTPRLTALNQQDVAAQVMSRGTGMARAAVEFSTWRSGERARYRATWLVRRARERSDGVVQATTRSLERRRADGGWAMLVSDHRGKIVDPVFKEMLEGFTSHDFQRSMLLAQGRFDALLNAAPEERAAILERLTDTGIYQRLGERAARMRAAWEARLGTLRARRDAVSPTSTDELAAAEEAARSSREALATVDARLERLGAWRDWLVGDLALARDVDEAEVERTRVGIDEDAARTSLAALAEHERCTEGFRRLDAHSEAARRLGDNAQAIAAVAASLPDLALAVERARLATGEAATAVGAAEQALADLRGPADEAIAASVALAEALREREAAATREANAAVEARKATDAVAAATKQLDEARATATTAQAQLDKLAADAPLPDALPALTALAAGLVEARTRLAQAQVEAGTKATALRRDHEALGTARATLATAATGRLAPLDQRVAEARAAAGEGDVAGPRGTYEAVRERVGVLTGVEREVAARDEAEGRAARATAGVDAGRVSEAEAACESAKIAEELAEARLAHADGVLAPLERIAALGDQRAALVHGEACPLCGSADHPFVHDPVRREQAATIDREVAAARQARTAADKARKDAAGARATAEKGLAAREAGAAAAQARATEARADAETARARARAALVAAELPEDAAAEAVGAARTEAATAAAVALEALRAAEAAVVVLKAAEVARAEAVAALAAEGARLDREAARLAQADHEQEARTEASAVQTDELARRRAAMAERLADFGVRAEPPEEGLAAVRARAEAWTTASREVERARVTMEQAATRQAGATAARVTADKAHADAVATLAERTGTRDAADERARGSRAHLRDAWSLAVPADLPDRPADDDAPERLVRFQDARVRTLRDALQDVDRRRVQAERAHADATARMQVLTELGAGLEAELAGAEAALAEELGRLELDGALAARRLAAADVIAGRAQRETLRTRRSEADARHDAVTRQLERHRGEGRPADLPPDVAPDAVATEMEAAREERRGHDAALQQATATLALAERLREQLAAAVQVLASAEADAAVWLRLHDLIGVGNGTRFKLFAQALNLEHLLAQANAHLLQLSPRYRLRVEPDEKTGEPTLDFVVEDLWRPGATRSLKTLSGGESFLVSLALALGLSDLRTSSMPVETLLLDEGFGTLDPQTLDTAMAALQQLHGTGRQVGIISHVGELQERIEARVIVEPLGEGRSRVRTQVGR